MGLRRKWGEKMETGDDIKNTLQSIDTTLKRIEQILSTKAKADNDIIIRELTERLKEAIKRF